MHPIIQNGGALTPKSFFSNEMINSYSNKKKKQNDYIGDDNISLIKLKLSIQQNIMKEYQYWINTLLLIIGEKNEDENIHFDTGTPIQEGLKKIEDLKKENFKIKEKLIKEISKNENLIKKIDTLKKKNKFINLEYSKDSLNNIINEKKQLFNNIQIFANEIDDLGEKKRKFDDYIESDNEMKKCSDLFNQYLKIKEDNQEIKKIVEIQNRKNCLNYGNKKLFQKYLINPKSMKNLGKFSLEKEENFQDLSFFGCGIMK